MKVLHFKNNPYLIIDAVSSLFTTTMMQGVSMCICLYNKSRKLTGKSLGQKACAFKFLIEIVKFPTEEIIYSYNNECLAYANFTNTTYFCNEIFESW